MSEPRFKRAVRGRPDNATDDAAGSVRISVCLLAAGRYVKGNICRSFTLSNAKVSEVADAIERCLFGDDGAP